MTYPWSSGEVLTAADLNAYAGLVYITSATATSGTSLTINNCFTSQFDNYRMVGTIIGSTATPYEASIRLRASGTNTTTGYYSAVTGTDIAAGSIYSGSLSNATYGTIGAITANAGRAHFVVDLANPQAAQFTAWSGQATDSRSAGAYAAISAGGTLSNTTQYDGIVVGLGGFATGTIANLTLRIYGYNNG